MLTALFAVATTTNIGTAGDHRVSADGVGRDDRVRRHRERRRGLVAFQGSPELLETRPADGRRPATWPTGYLAARAVHVMPAKWRAQEFMEGCPEGAVDRAGSISCMF